MALFFFWVPAFAGMTEKDTGIIYKAIRDCRVAAFLAMTFIFTLTLPSPLKGEGKRNNRGVIKIYRF